MKIYFCLLFSCFLLSAQAQKDELFKDISLTTCDCIKDADPEMNFEMMIGLCMLKGSSPHAEQLKELTGLDLADIDNYEELGEMLAPSLIANCPEFMTVMMDAAEAGEIDLSTDEEDSANDTDQEAKQQRSWSDMGGQDKEVKPEFGGPENKKFITAPIENTNGAGLSKPKVKGRIKTINAGLTTAIELKGDDGKNYRLYLDRKVVGAEKLKKGKSVVIAYRNTTRFHAGDGRRKMVKVILAVE